MENFPPNLKEEKERKVKEKLYISCLLSDNNHPFPTYKDKTKLSRSTGKQIQSDSTKYKFKIMHFYDVSSFRKMCINQKKY